MIKQTNKQMILSAILDYVACGGCKIEKILYVCYQYKGISYSKQQINQMREWVSDCGWREEYEPEEIAELPALVILKGINRHYCGGLAGFIESL